ncbi:MAG: mannose-1-phosphate guanylyltransferase [Candidatus Andersenbacteria bacterium]|nr:mannose-1-phosphate guanylyltransferase [Candidatus Andersenbacteria bacterium]MBI3250472.1 mannose-1-phosphate guanylyltransferase [Candidatus Andersenbacteria bacterium]
MNVVIMAGGGGTRLWPLSVRDNPKQFVDLGTGKPLLVHAYERATALTSPENIFVATSEKYAKQIEQLLPGVTTDHLLLEPAKRDTTAAFLNVCLNLIASGKGDMPTTFLWSDHVFANEEVFLKDLQTVPALLEQYPEALIIAGHVPLNPNTTLGYFKVGEALAGKPNVYHVEKFIEKPNKETAEGFVAAGGYFWNLGYFSLKPTYLLSQVTTLSPEWKEASEELASAITSKDTDKWRQVYENLPKVALEKTFVEKTKTIIAVTGDYGWSDVGNWATVKEIFGKVGDHMPAGHHIHVDSENNFIYNTTDKAVSLIGIDNAVVVVTDKAVLVCDTDAAHKVKEVVERIEREGKKEYL